MENSIKVSKYLLKNLCDGNSCNYLPEGKVKEIIQVGLDPFVIVSSSSTHAAGHKVTLLNLYSGNVKPADYYESSRLEELGKRELGYDGMTFNHKGDTMILFGPKIYFEAAPEPEQLVLFYL